jgi:subtilisin-like proprotein convertase family protein
MSSRLRRCLFALGVLVGGVLTTQSGLDAQKSDLGPTKGLASPSLVARAVNFGITPRVSDLKPPELKDSQMDQDLLIKGTAAPKEIKNPRLPKAERADQSAARFGVQGFDAAVQALAPEINAPATTINFEGISNENNFAVFGGRVLPPDTVGDVGPNHYVQAVNLLFRVFDKTGAPLTAALPMSTLFASIGGTCAGTDDGDPIVLYDHLADRWILTQFALTAPVAHQCIAISQTGDPTGAYFAYDFLMPNAKLNDYPKFGVWPDAYYMTDNQFNQAGTLFLGGGVFAFERLKMLVGDPNASFIYFDLEQLDATIGGMLPADLDGAPPPAGAPGLFAYFIADEFMDPGGDGLRLFDFHADFQNPMSSTFTERAESPVVVAAFSPLTPPGRDDIQQPPPAVAATESLDAIGDRLMHRLVYRNYGTHESLVTNHTVNVGTGTTVATYRAGVRYYDLQRSGGAFTVAEQSTFAPADGASRWMGSAATDNQGNLTVGYSITSTTIFPGARYAARLATDPPGGLTQGEASLVEGGFVQRSTLSRWGDYSSVNVDPVDECTFWITNEYYQADNPATTAEWQTRVGAFKFPSCTAPVRGTLSGTVSDCNTGAHVPGALVVAGAYSRVTDANGNFSMDLPPGTYTVTVIPPTGYAAPASQTVTVPPDGTTTANFCLMGVPVLEGVSATLVGEGCAPENDAVDPGETVIFDITIRNTGFGTTPANLVGTLLPNATTKQPSGPRTYGAIPPGGTATQRYTWKAAGLCGQDYLLQLLLTAGATSFGTVEFTGTLGAETPNAASNPGVITIPNSGPASPYPSTIEVAGVTGAVSKVTVTLSGLTHTFPGDLDFLLVGPGGQKAIFMSDVGGGTDVTGITLTFDDDAAPPPAALVSGTFRPTDITPGDVFPAPAPAGPYVASLAGFKGTNPNGTWRLFALDDAGGDLGQLAGGWSLNITTLSCTVQCGNVRSRLQFATTLHRVTATAVLAEIFVTNAGNGVAQGVEITSAMLGSFAGAPLPQLLGNILPGQTLSIMVAFDPAPPAGGRTNLQIVANSAEGERTATLRVIVP